MNQNYRALTRTYRPQSFEDIVSQEHVSNTLKNAIRDNRLSHAYMFCGPRGVGKTTMARVLARAVNEVSDVVDGESLSRTLNIVEMDAASNRKIEDVRSLKEVIRVPPQNGRYKIFIIDEVHMLTKEAFNALLKTLEEPPAHAIFIFATTEPHKILPTILSRVQRFDFKRISVGEIVDRLRTISEKESIRIDDESLHVIAKRADGALRDALGLMDQAIAFCGDQIEYKELLRALNVVDRDDLFSFMQAVKARNSLEGLTLIRGLLQAGTDIQEFLGSLTEHIRNLYVAHSSKRLHLLEATEETRKRYARQAGDYSENDLMQMLHLVSEAQLKLKEAQQPGVHFEILMLKLIHMSHSKELDTLLFELQDLKKNSSNEELNETSGSAARPGMSGAERVSGPEPDRSGPEPDSGPMPDRSGPEPDSRPAPDNGPAGQKMEENRTEPPGNYDGLYGRPSFGDKDIRTAPAAVHSVSEVKASPKSTPANGINGIRDVIDKWEEFLVYLEKKAPRVLYLQMQRVKISSLKERRLQVIVDNEFARQLVEENQDLLSNSLKEEFGVSLKIHCKVERGEKKENSGSLSPYEQFKELQKKDPHIRTLVELFGAELEY